MDARRVKPWALLCAKVWFVLVILTDSTYCASGRLGRAARAAQAAAMQWRQPLPAPWQSLESGLAQDPAAGFGKAAMGAAVRTQGAAAAPGPAPSPRSGAGWSLEIDAGREAAKLSVAFVFESVVRDGRLGWLADNDAGEKWGGRCRFRALVPLEMDRALGIPRGLYGELPRPLSLDYIAAHEAAHCAAARDPSLARLLVSMGGRTRSGEAMADLYAASTVLSEAQALSLMARFALVDRRDPHSNGAWIAEALRRGAGARIRSASGRDGVRAAMEELMAVKAPAAAPGWAAPAPGACQGMWLAARGCRMDPSDSFQALAWARAPELAGF